MAKLSPMMSQYFDLKKSCKDQILFFRLGDFYEMFYDDAELVSNELDLTLTGRDCGQDEKAPMCGVPYHSSESYIARLVARGYKVAICEQVEDPSKSKGLVKREIVRVVTPGTVIEDSMLDETSNNFICSIFESDNSSGICFSDISTGELYATIIKGDNRCLAIKDELSRFSPKEILISGEIAKLSGLCDFIKHKLYATVEMIDDTGIDLNYYEKILLKHFQKESLSELNLCNKNELVYSLGGLIKYIQETQKKGTERINAIEFYKESQFVKLDINTRRNLELTKTMRSTEKRGSLLWVLDKTKTAMGKRLIKSWMDQPLINCNKILFRQEAVKELYFDSLKRESIIKSLSGIHDLERLSTKIVYGSANARDLCSINTALSFLPSLKDILKDSKSSLLQKIYSDIDLLQDITSLLDSSIDIDPPFSVREGGIIKKGYNKEIDKLREDMDIGKNFVANIETQEKKNTGIQKLKVGYNRVFGYYIEVSNSYKSMVPESYIRKQTLTNCERYITQELKELEGRILGAKDKVIQLEYDIFKGILELISKELVRIQKTARAIATLDVICSFSEVSSKNNYVCPKINNSGSIVINDGRHPVIEKLLDNVPFVPNDVKLNKELDRVAVITGPNMAGKSTYMRQTALIVLMAQMGCFIPARSAEIGIVDSIFTRVGASDDLASGQSTFMVEMSEVANIINNATGDSLIILDEIGRGTSTFDGMSIARAVLEYVADTSKLGAKTLFSTHYHELTELENYIPGVKNYNVAVKKRGDDITFLRRIVPGGADDSYGIEVAKLAGIPETIINRSKQILSDLESGSVEVNIHKKEAKMNNSDTNGAEAIIQKLRKIDVNTLTPIEAMSELFNLVGMLK